MPGVGFEPTHPCGPSGLNRLRLPVSPPGPGAQRTPRGRRQLRWTPSWGRRGDKAMILADHVADYLHAVSGPRSELMVEMEALAERDSIPIVQWETGRLLAVLVAALQPKRVIEVGTAIGYSTMHMARALGPD